MTGFDIHFTSRDGVFVLWNFEDAKPNFMIVRFLDEEIYSLFI